MRSTWRSSGTSTTRCGRRWWTGWSKWRTSASCTTRRCTWPSTTSTASSPSWRSSERSCSWSASPPSSSPRAWTSEYLSASNVEWPLCRKYEEIYPPAATEFVYLTDDTYTVRQMLKMEMLMLKVLKFNVTVPTANGFLGDIVGGYGSSRRAGLSADVARRLECYSKVRARTHSDLEPCQVWWWGVFSLNVHNCYCLQYLCEQCLVNGEVFLNYLPSQVAASAYLVASATLGLDPWVSCRLII